MHNCTRGITWENKKTSKDLKYHKYPNELYIKIGSNTLRGECIIPKVLKELRCQFIRIFIKEQKEDIIRKEQDSEFRIEIFLRNLIKTIITISGLLESTLKEKQRNEN